MSDVLYESNPSMFRNHPFLFLFWLVVIAVGIAGIVLAPTGDYRMAGVAVMFVGIIALFIWFVQCKSVQLTVTARDVSLRRGILSKSSIELNLDSIRSVNVHQSLFQRMFGVGSVAIYTAGDVPEIAASGMPDPGRLRALLRGDGTAGT